MPFNLRETLSNFLSDYIKQILALIFLSSAFVGLAIKFRNFLLTPFSFKPVYLLMLVISALFLFFIIRKKFKKEKYNIQIKRRFYNDSEPNQLGRKTKWNYKKNQKYYYIPLLSHSQYSVQFVDFCGPWCAECNHIMHLQQSYYRNPKFLCINCLKKYTIPTELLGNYKQKIFEYFKAEYSQGRVKEMNGSY